jgi:hypothetical protein
MLLKWKKYKTVIILKMRSKKLKQAEINKNEKYRNYRKYSKNRKIN